MCSTSVSPWRGMTRLIVDALGRVPALEEYTHGRRWVMRWAAACRTPSDGPWAPRSSANWCGTRPSQRVAGCVAFGSKACSRPIVTSSTVSSSKSMWVRQSRSPDRLRMVASLAQFHRRAGSDGPRLSDSRTLGPLVRQKGRRFWVSITSTAIGLSSLEPTGFGTRLALTWSAAVAGVRCARTHGSRRQVP